MIIQFCLQPKKITSLHVLFNFHFSHAGLTCSQGTYSPYSSAHRVSLCPVFSQSYVMLLLLSQTQPNMATCLCTDATLPWCSIHQETMEMAATSKPHQIFPKKAICSLCVSWLFGILTLKCFGKSSNIPFVMHDVKYTIRITKCDENY